ncbi:hypothetical protein SNEBB_001106 [Seison nebaliae]|nr:hypothetical protein SNEBB_001106 [Seison nebaliae]
MGKKSKNLYKKNVKHYALVYRSYKDPLINDSEAGNTVLQPMKQIKIMEDQEKLKKNHKYGIYFDDDYNYFQHMKDIDNVETEEDDDDNKDEESIEKLDDSTKTDGDMTSHLLFSSEQLEEETIFDRENELASLRLEWDPEIANLLDRDTFDPKEEGFDEIEDNFIELANQSDSSDDEEDEEYDINLNEHTGNEQSYTSIDDIAQFLQKKKSKTAEEKLFKGKEKKLENDCFTNYSMSSASVPRTEIMRIMDDRFEELYKKEYGYDDMIGDLKNKTIKGKINDDNIDGEGVNSDDNSTFIPSDLSDNDFSDTENCDENKFPTFQSKESEDDSQSSQSKCLPSLTEENLDDNKDDIDEILKGAIDQFNCDYQQRKTLTEILNDDSKNNLTQEEKKKINEKTISLIKTMEKHEMDDKEIDILVKKNEEDRFDCESILSTYSNIYNRPVVLNDDEFDDVQYQKEKKMIRQQELEELNKEKVILSKKTGIPLNTIDHLTRRQIQKMEHDAQKKELTVQYEMIKGRHNLEDQNGKLKKCKESKEERKARKSTIRQMKKERREEKKYNRLVHKEMDLVERNRYAIENR